MDDPPRKRIVRPPRGGILGGHAPPARLKTARSRTASSQAWLERQINDPFSAAARAHGYRSRAAYKLLEIDDRFHLLGKGSRVADLGCAPGGWIQVALERGAGLVVGVDLLAVDPLPPAEIFQDDFTDPEIEARLLQVLDGRVDLVLSDMAPNTTGHRQTDHLRIAALIDAAAAFAGANLARGGAFVTKAFQGGELAPMLQELKRTYARVRHFKPKASRSQSSEVYIVATGFRGPGA
jgi:23S rRNA (uridine2552-2'-O)-methyltransferase